MEEMFAFNTPEIDAFRTMYGAEDGSPVLVKETEVVDLTTGADDLQELGVRIYPNPVLDGQLRVEGLSGKVTSIRVFNAAGSLVAERRGGFGPSWVQPLPPGSGTYVVQVEAGGRSYIERIVVIR
jgi:hypothetical protein